MHIEQKGLYRNSNGQDSLRAFAYSHRRRKCRGTWSTGGTVSFPVAKLYRSKAACELGVGDPGSGHARPGSRLERRQRLFEPSLARKLQKGNAGAN